MTEEEKIICKEFLNDADTTHSCNEYKLLMALLDQEPITKNDLALIHTWGLDEGIRCAMCTNSMKSDRGCDGSCVVNNAMYKEVMDVIENHIVDTGKKIESTTKNDLEVDVISEGSRYERGGRGMTEEEKIICKQFLNDADKTHSCNEYKLLMALLEQDPKSEWQKDHEILKAYSDGANEAIDKIRAEIEQLTITDSGDDYVRRMAELFSLKMKALQIIDKYKAESEVEE